mgnify:CR=1 FL=1
MRRRAAHAARHGSASGAICLAVGRVFRPSPIFDRFLHGEIAGRPGVAMAEAEQQIDVGGPRADAVQRRQRVVRGVGVLVRQHVEIQPLGGEFARDVLQRLDLGRRQTEPAEPVGARLADRVMVETDRTRR